MINLENNWKALGAGLLIGVLSGLLGIGGGVFMVPIMVSYFGVTQHIAQATSLAVVIPTAIVSSIVYSLHGSIDYSVALQLILGSIVGASLGARLMKKLPAVQLKRLFAFMLILVGVRMVIG
ncbi:hypothetical protein ALO_03031 [Acetonema longum DSM 6540]|uniref:Probable membrane transporter protein n=2 Tax=Acetonema TaxID=2373 RepID=F7NEY9_9FIRM|nr:sulfite exporter TauE/SafE family protein [Acetonema longum]EGO65550.1 hypothetical protein ALO_03031 [Acetonema longum DSM 6540]